MRVFCLLVLFDFDVLGANIDTHEKVLCIQSKAICCYRDKTTFPIVKCRKQSVKRHSNKHENQEHITKHLHPILILQKKKIFVKNACEVVQKFKLQYKCYRKSLIWCYLLHILEPKRSFCSNPGKGE